MIDVPVIRELYRYNRWANNRLLEAVAPLKADEFTRDLGSSYPSLRDTLVHIVWAEWVWLQRWNGSSPRAAFQPADFPNWTRSGPDGPSSRRGSSPSWRR